MRNFIPFIIIIPLFLMLAGCQGMGKVNAEAADKTVTQMKEKYPEQITEITIFRDKLQVAFKKDLHPQMKANIFMDVATAWWSAYPNDKKPGHKLYCFAYDEVISDDDIGSLQMQRGPSNAPKVFGQPGIYSLRDVK